MENLNDDLKLYNEFAEEAMLNKNHGSWVQKRKPSEYGFFEIISEGPEFWWFNRFIGVKFMGIIKGNDTAYDKNNKPIHCKRIVPVAFIGNTKIHHGRDIPSYYLNLL